MKTRRGFFGAIAGAVAGLVGAHAVTPAPEPSPAAREIAELSAAFEKLRVQMEKPITLTMQIDGREIARQSVLLTPSMLRESGR